MHYEKKRVLSGMRPTGPLHLGHYVGALDNWKKMADEYDCYFMVADWHALTTEYEEPARISSWIKELFLDFLSAGLDPEKSVLFVQSDIKEHAELTLLLGMLTPLSWLERVPTYKEQKQQLVNKDLSTYGFLGYPLLQTADIIIYNADRVPVGQDQLPHLELAREIVRRFNYLYGTYFTEPEGLLSPAPKLPGIDGRKMSKSYDNAIYLKDSPEEIMKKINQMVTDPARVRRNDKGHPEVCSVYSYQEIFNTDQKEEIAEGCRTASIGCRDCKKQLFERIWQELEPVQKKRKELQNNMDFVNEVREQGKKKALQRAEKTIRDVHRLMGLL